MPHKIKLRRFLANTGIFRNRYETEKALESGLVKVDNKTVKGGSFDVKKKHHVFYNNKEIKMVAKSIYIILNKPIGYLSQKDPSRKNVYDIVNQMKEFSDDEKKTMFNVGRLDIDTEGLLIMTNDGQLSNKIINSSKFFEKTYFVILDKPLLPKDKLQLEKGVKIVVKKDGKRLYYKTREAKVKLLDDKELELTITEGKKRQIRKMLMALGYAVVFLKRISIGRLSTGSLTPGQHKILAKEEIYDNLFG